MLIVHLGFSGSCSGLLSWVFCVEYISPNKVGFFFIIWFWKWGFDPGVNLEEF